MKFIEPMLLGYGVSPEWSAHLAMGIALILLVVICVLADYIARKLISTTLRRLVLRSSSTWDDTLANNRVFTRLAHLAPAWIAYEFARYVFPESTALHENFQTLMLLMLVLLALMLIYSLIDAFLENYRQLSVSREVPLKSFTQVLKLILSVAALIFAVSLVVDKSPLTLISGLSALTAVLLLIFRDSIMGFVAGIQLISNRMVAVGDWIEMPSHGADGAVLEVSLATVKVQNWDRTISTIPTYEMISRSFKNWRGMAESGGRRIKRSINIDMNTIRFCDDDMLQRFSRIQYIRDYIATKKRELAEHNSSERVDDDCVVNGRRLTNIGVLRAYIVAYLHNNPNINNDMTAIVRQLSPGEHGLPIEIYVFSKEKIWVEYEAIQSDIFDHILASVPEFDLRIYQQPAGHDFRAFVGTG